MLTEVPKKVTLHCDICVEPLATAELKSLKVPLAGSMFDELQPGYPRPWVFDVGWLWMLCPHCGFRAVIDENVISTEYGRYNVQYGEFIDWHPVDLTPDPALEAEWNARMGNVDAPAQEAKRRGRPPKVKE